MIEATNQDANKNCINTIQSEIPIQITDGKHYYPNFYTLPVTYPNKLKIINNNIWIDDQLIDEIEKVISNGFNITLQRYGGKEIHFLYRGCDVDEIFTLLENIFDNK